jgi:hypothetical protein
MSRRRWTGVATRTAVIDIGLFVFGYSAATYLAIFHWSRVSTFSSYTAIGRAGFFVVTDIATCTAVIDIGLVFRYRFLAAVGHVVVAVLEAGVANYAAGTTGTDRMGIDLV